MEARRLQAGRLEAGRLSEVGSSKAMEAGMLQPRRDLQRSAVDCKLSGAVLARAAIGNLQGPTVDCKL